MGKVISKTELDTMRVNNRCANEANRYATDLRRKALANNQPFVSNHVRTDIYNDLFTDGVIIQYPHGRVMQHGQKPFYYRGQIKDYGSCKSSLIRKICNADEWTMKCKIFENELKLYEFNELIFQFKQVKEWPFGDVFTYAIAQHYGFDTNIIDVTNDLEVALFFACCKHIGNNKYRPLCEDDLKSENDRHGVLFVRNQVTDMMEATENNGLMTVYPIGYQPFTRCHRQKGFFVNTVIDDDLQTSGQFNMFSFEHSAQLSRDIFDEFNGGKDLFAYDALNEIQDLITEILTSKSYSEKSFCAVYENNSNGIPQREWVEILKTRLGVQIGCISYKLTRPRKRAIDRIWSIDKFIKQEKIAPGYRMTL